jgi:hypothetical protein
MAVDLRDRALWRHVIVEIVIVTVGILIAFSLDSWWDGRRNAAREHAYLEALESDFKDNAGRLREISRRDANVQESATALLTLMRRDPDAPREDVVPLLTRVFSSLMYEPVLGAYDALVSSGDLELLSDHELRRWIVQFASTVKADKHEQFANEAYESFRNDLVGKLQIGAWGPKSDDSAVIAVQQRWNTRLLFEDPRFADHLALRQNRAREMGAYHNHLAERAEAIVARIGALRR